MRNFFGVHINEQKGNRIFSKNIDLADYIVVSPGINLKKTKLRKKLIENKHKIITDIDLFYLFNPEIRISEALEGPIYPTIPHIL